MWSAGLIYFDEFSKELESWGDDISYPGKRTEPIYQIDGVSYKLREPYDFSFLKKYGKVFKVFDERPSGNISFGIQNGDKRYFVKFAGAKTVHYNEFNGDPQSAIARLKESACVYQDLAYNNMIKFVNAEEIGGGYATVFIWEDASGLEMFNTPEYLKFMQMPIEKRVKAFEDIITFHAYVAAKGYVAIDFFEGSIMYDYDKNQTIICDLDFYRKSPYIGDLGVICHSGRLASPEERVADEVMDEITNVYTMGAIAFSLLSYCVRTPEVWPLNKALYDVVKRAVSDERSKRQQSINQLIEEWKAAKRLDPGSPSLR